MATATTYGARDHARAQEGGRAEAMPVVPAGDWPAPPCEAGHLVWAETVAGGNYTHRVLARGTELRLTDLRGDACAHLLLYAADRPWERLNVADTVKVQWNAYLGEGRLLLSDQGRVLASLVADTSGRHDALCGTSTLVRNTERYGDGTPQSDSPQDASCSSSPPPRTAWNHATCRPRSPSSRASRSATTAPSTSPARPAPAAA